MKLKSILYILMIVPFLWSCNDEDDVEEIFVSGTWHVVNYFGKANWDKRNGDPKYKPADTAGRNALQTIQTFTLLFNVDGSFVGKMQSGNFKGKWQADGKERTIRLRIEGSPGTSSSYDREYIETLQNVEFYQGDSNVLLLAPEDKKSFIQFSHKKE